MKREKLLSVATVLLVGIFVVSAVGIAIATPGNSDEATSRVFVSGNPASIFIVKNTFPVQHEFKDGITVEVGAKGLAALEKMPGIQLEAVPLYHVLGRPFCNNNGVCEPELGENPSCSDCKNGGEKNHQKKELVIRTIRTLGAYKK